MPPAFELSPPKGPEAWAYTSISALYLLTAAACFAPEVMCFAGHFPWLRSEQARGLYFTRATQADRADGADHPDGLRDRLPAWRPQQPIAVQASAPRPARPRQTIFTGDPYSTATPLIKAIWAPGFTLAAVMAYVLKASRALRLTGACTRQDTRTSSMSHCRLGLRA